MQKSTRVTFIWVEYVLTLDYNVRPVLHSDAEKKKRKKRKTGLRQRYAWLVVFPPPVPHLDERRQKKGDAGREGLMPARWNFDPNASR